MTRTYDNDAQLEDVPVEDAIERARNKREKRAKPNGSEPPERAPPLGEKPTLITLTWHGEDTDEPLVEWAVEDMAYMIGVALIAGQWGTYKTFVALDLAGSIMTKAPFAGRAVHRQGGVLFIAAEGQAQLRIRLRGLAIGKIAEVEPGEGAVRIDPERMPFAWATRSPRLSDPDAIGELRALVAEAARGMRERFDLPLALVVIDALMPAAQFKDADKTTEGRQVMDMLAALARHAEVLVVAVDHFGKDVSTGTRNASSKEDAADTILALLGERTLEGRLTNPRMATRKVKGAEQGVEFPFEPREVIVGETKAGNPIKTFVVEWRASGDGLAKKPVKAWPRSLLIFKRALDKTLDESGKRVRPFLDGAEVLAVPTAALRAEFMKTYPADNADPKAQAKARAKAFERAIKQAVEDNLVCAREIEAEKFETFYWRMDVK
jgi:AAA domain